MKMKCVLIGILLIFGLGRYGFAQTGSLKQDVLKEAYYESEAFKLQIGKTQVITGGVLLSGGAGMIVSGIIKKINYVPPTDAEGVEIPNAGSRGPGVGLIVAGGMSGIAGAILLKRGLNSLKEFRNKKGEVVSELNLSSSGTGLSLKF